MHSFIIDSLIFYTNLLILYNKLQRAAYSSMPNAWLALHTAAVQPNLFSVESDFIPNYFSKLSHLAV